MFFSWSANENRVLCISVAATKTFRQFRKILKMFSQKSNVSLRLWGPRFLRKVKIALKSTHDTRMFASIRWWFTAPSVRSTLALRNHRLPLSGLRLRNVVLKLAFVVKASVIYMYVRHGMLQSLAIPTSPIYDVDTEVKLPKRLKRFIIVISQYF